MNDNQRVRNAFSNIKAPDDMIDKVYNSINSHKNQNRTRRIICMSMLGTVLTGTIVLAVMRFQISNNFLNVENKEYSEETRNSISIIEHNNEIQGKESIKVNGFFISYPFEKNNSPYSLGEYAHSGIDIIADKGTKVLAVADGKVTKAEFGSAYGYHIVIEHTDGYETLYAHLQEIKVSVGDTITAGDEIGTVGATGMATGPHLHLELRCNGESINPLEYIDE